MFLFKIKGIDSNYSCERSPCFNKRTPILTEGHLDDPEAQGGRQVPQTRKLFLTLLIKIKIKCIKNSTFNDVRNTRVLYLSEIGLAFPQSRFGNNRKGSLLSLFHISISIHLYIYLSNCL